MNSQHRGFHDLFLDPEVSKDNSTSGPQRESQARAGIHTQENQRPYQIYMLNYIKVVLSRLDKMTPCRCEFLHPRQTLKKFRNYVGGTRKV